MKDRNETFVAMPLRRGRGRLLDVEARNHAPVLLEALGRAMHWQALLDECELSALWSHFVFGIKAPDRKSVV